VIIKRKSVGSYERQLNRIQLRGEVTGILNRLIDDIYEERLYFDIKAIEIIIEGSEPIGVGRDLKYPSGNHGPYPEKA